MSTAAPDHRARADRDDETTVVITLLSLIDGGFAEGEDALADTTAAQCGLARQAVLSILHRYTGETFGDSFWSTRRGTRGQRLYQLLPPI